MATRARGIAPVALAALSTAAALSLGRVFDSGRFVVAVVAAAVLPHVIGVIARRRSWSAAVTVTLTVIALAAFVVWALVPSTTWLGLPTGSTIETLERQLRGGWHVLRTEPAPAPVTGGTRLLAVLVTWTIATVADWIAFRRHATLAAIAPALVLFVWASTLGSSDHETVTVAGFAVAAGAFLAVQNAAVLDRSRSWLVSSQPVRAHWLVPAALLGLVALLVGLVLAPAVPGAESDPLIDLTNRGPNRSGGGSYNTRVPPLLDVGAKLRVRANIELFTVKAAQADYWRLVALDDFSSDNGVAQWTLRAEGADEVRAGLPDTGPRGSLNQRFAIGPLGERWLPAAYRPVASDTDALAVVSSATLVSEHDSVQGLDYDVHSLLPTARADVTAAEQAATARPVPSDVRAFTQLPPGLPSEIREKARRVVDDAGATTPYAQAAALRDYFWANFEYDVDVDLADDTAAITNFLHDRRGFCVQFASTYAVMARSLGIPARVAVGFTPGTLDGGAYHVRSHDAHAWPEIYLSGLGWTHLFDPTPPAGGGRTGGSRLPADATAAGPMPANPAVTTTTLGAGSGSAGVGSSGGAPATTRAPLTPRVSTSGAGGRSAWLVILAIVTLLVALACAYVAIVVMAKSRRRARRRAATERSAAVQGAWEEALDRLREARVPSDPALTPMELARSAPRYGVTAATRPLRTLARSYTVARYGDAPPSTEDVQRAWESVHELDRALVTGLSRRERWRRLLDPSTLRR